MPSKRFVQLLVLVMTATAVVPWWASPALAFTEGGSDNFFGTGAGANDSTGDDDGNSFFGGFAGNANSSGARNSFFGGLAGNTNTTGNNNAFFGYGAGFKNNTASGNSFFGTDAGQNTSVGEGNSFFGRSAGFSNISCCNSYFGKDAGLANTTGSDNSFVGHRAGLSNTTACCNAFVGADAGWRNTTGAANSFIGQGTGQSNTGGEENVFVGQQTGNSNDTGSENSFVGTAAGQTNTVENANTFLGYRSTGAAGVTNATAIGHRAQASQSNSLVLGSIAGLNDAASDTRVGIGTPAPVNALHVRRTDGTSRVFVEEASATTAGRALFQLTNNGASRFRITNSNNGVSWDFQTSSGPGSFVIDRVGGPGTLDVELKPTGELVLNNTVTAAGFITSSDRNAKTDIAPADASKLMTLLAELDISTWRFRTEPKGTLNLGPMAQDFHRLFGMGTDTTIDVRDLAALAVVAAQALDDQNADQEKEIVALKTAVAELSRR